MGNNLVKIGKPYTTMNDGYARLCAEIDLNGEKKVYYYQVDEKWGKYLTVEYSDPFVLAVIKKAMKHSWDISYETPMSEDLYYQLTTYLIPVYARNLQIFHEIKLLGSTTDTVVDTLGVAGTGFSAGVDSFYSVLKHRSVDGAPNHNVSHLVLAVNGAANTGYSENLDEKWLSEELELFQPLADEMGLELIGIRSNVDSMYFGDPALNGEVIITSSFVHSLRKLFGIYYWASAFQAEILDPPEAADGPGSGSLPTTYVSVKGLRFYASGSETDRIGKVKFIADEPVVQKGLTVCGHVKSCNRCDKCLRTMSELYAIKKLDLYSNIFDIADFKKHLTSRLAEEFIVDREHETFIKEIKREMRCNGIRIPFTVYLKQYLIYYPYTVLKEKLRKVTWVRKLYYKFDLDEKIGGAKQDEEMRQIRLTGKGK